MDMLQTSETANTSGEQPEDKKQTAGDPDIQALNERVAEYSRFVDAIRSEMGRTIVGQTDMVDRLLIGMLANGHILLEGVPGLAKTLAIKSLSESVAGEFSRVQFTPDLLPADVVGTLIYNQQSQQFTVKKGPIFANFVLGMKSIVHRPKCKVHCLRPCKSAKSPSAENLTSCRGPFWFWPLKILSSRKEHIPFPKRKSIVFC